MPKLGLLAQGAKGVASQNVLPLNLELDMAPFPQGGATPKKKGNEKPKKSMNAHWRSKSEYQHKNGNQTAKASVSGERPSKQEPKAGKEIEKVAKPHAPAFAPYLEQNAKAPAEGNERSPSIS